jgi:hypothetical protein
MSRTLIIAPLTLLVPVALAASLAHSDPEFVPAPVPDVAAPVSAALAADVAPSSAGTPRNPELEARVRAALSGKSRGRQRARAPFVAKRSEASPALTWTCGAWVELRQGSGKGRSCEWRPVSPRVAD